MILQEVSEKKNAVKKNATAKKLVAA